MLKRQWHFQGVMKNFTSSRITNDPIIKNNKNVKCFPLYSMLLSLNRTNVDYFSLDIEGNELDVLKTIPWDKVEITVISADVYWVDDGKQALKDYMKSKGYKLHFDGSLLKNTPRNVDYIFYHPEYLQKTLKSVKDKLDYVV